MLATPKMRTCLDENEVLAFVEGHLAGEELRTLEVHLVGCGACHELLGAAARALDGGRPGAEPDEVVIGRYRLVAPLGYGGGGIVYRARHVETGAWAAIKTVQLRAPLLLSAIRREIRTLSRLDHPAIVHVLDHGIAGGRPWYAMELLDGETLADRLRRWWDAPDAPRARAAAGQLDRVLAIARRLCEPLAFLHGEGIVHRDLKPQNVFLRAGDEPVLVDFGLIGRVPGTLGRETAEVPNIDGTPAYMAPEQIAGELTDARTDLYALGCLIFEMVAGRPPFTGERPGEILAQHRRAEAPALGRLVEGVPPALEALVRALLAKSPRARLGHADDVAAALEKLGAPAPSEAPRPRRPSVYRPSLLGRDDVLERLGAQVAAAERGRGGVGVIVGESGIGKTYLAAEVARRGRRLAVIEGACLPVEAVAPGQAAVLAPFHNLLELVTDRCQLLGRDTTARLLGPRGKVLELLAPRFAELPGQDAYPPPPELTGTAARDRLLAALGDTLAALAREQPILLLLDDLHWADELTLRFLSSLTSEYFAALPLYVLATCRSEEGTPALAELLGRPFVEAITLGRLDGAAVRSLVVDMLAWDAPPDPLVAALARQSEGNPFFVAESVRTAVAEGLVKRRAGAWVAEVDPASLSLPPTLRELVGRRLRGLSSAALALCEAAAVLGRELEAELLEPAAGAADGEALDAVSELLARQVLEQPEAGRLRFMHHKLQEIAYEGIAAPRRAALHRSAAEAIERRHGGETPAHFAPLAHHWEAAGDEPRAQHYLERAGAHALSVAAYEQAAQSFARALALDERGSGERARAERRAHWQLGLGRASFGMGDLDALEEQALRSIESLGVERPRTRAGWLKLLGGGLATQLQHLAGGGRTAAPARHAALGDLALSAGLLSQRYFYLDDVLAMTAMVLLSVNSAERAGADAPVPLAYAAMGGLAGFLRARRVSARYFERAHRAADKRHEVSEHAMALAVEAVMEGSLGEWPRARAASDRLEALLPSLRDPLTRENVITTLCHVDFFVGRYDAAARHAGELLASARASVNAQHVMWGLYFVAREACRRGAWADAVPLLDEARRALAERPEMQSEINCAGLLALAHLHLGNTHLARRLADQTLALIARSRPTGFPSLGGYGAVAEVYRALHARARGGSADAAALDRGWRAARRALWSFAVPFPCALPAALAEEGRAQLAAGRPRLARLWFLLTRRYARKFAMAGELDAADAAIAAL